LTVPPQVVDKLEKTMEQANANGSAVIKQRIYRSEEEILKHLKDQEESGFTQSEYCQMFDINEQTFSSWIKKYRKSEEEGSSFTTIEIIPSREAKPQLYAEISRDGIKLYKEVSAEYLKILLS
jgi:transposase-like protein